MIIADIGVNHGGKREMMERMIIKAAETGIDVAKFQSFRADKLRKDFPDYNNLYQFYKAHELSEDDHWFIKTLCNVCNIGFLTTVFDLETVDFIKELGLKEVKISSPDCNNWALLAKCFDNFEHVYISTGAHFRQEISQLQVFLMEDNKRKRATVMHCVSNYPTELSHANMRRLVHLQTMFPKVGYSDHTIGTAAARHAISLGVNVIEKHFTLDNSMDGPDHICSGTPQDFAAILSWQKVVSEMNERTEMIDGRSRIHIGKWV
jgi:N,N'-diacetyllegionaminate synthase